MIKKLFAALITFVAFSSLVNGQGKSEAAVAKATEELRAAMVNADKNVLEKLTADKLSYGHSSGKIEDKTSFVNSIANGVSDFVSIDLTEQTISVSGKTAIVRHILKAKTNDGGRPGEAHIRILLIWQKQKGDWKLLARQAVKVS
jgi:ketosteroid isomerase-like protein